MEELLAQDLVVPVEAVEMQVSTTTEAPAKTRAEIFREHDPYGVAMALSAMSVVFTALITLYLIFKALGSIFKRAAAHKLAPAAVPVTQKAEEVKKLTGDEFAAIAIALYRYSQDLHDVEKTVLTINRAAKVYSPWSSKIYGLRQLPNK